MIRFGKITRAIKSFLVEIQGLGGTTNNRYVSPKGLYAKPKEETGLVIPLADGTSQDVVFVLQKDISELKDGDVRLTNDSSYIHFHFEDKKIEIKSAGEIEIVADNKIEIKNSSASLGKILTDIVSELKTLTTVGSPASQNVSPKHVTAFGLIEAKIKQLMKE